MKSPLFLSLFCLIVSIARPQQIKPDQSFIKRRCTPAYISLLQKRERPESPSPFRSFLVIDSRADTSRIGLVIDGRVEKEVLFHLPTADLLASYLNEKFASPSGNQSLLIVIKKLWLYNSVTIKKAKETIFTDPIDRGKIQFRSEAYLRVGQGYLPLTFLDTVISTSGSLGLASSGLRELFDAFVDKLSSLDLDEIRNRRRIISYNEIDSFNRKKFAYPMDTATILKKGVYANVEEFRGNEPSILQYEVVKGKNGEPSLYLRDEQGKLYYSHTMWGYCDGEHCYVMMEGALFPIFPVDHAWYAWGSKEYNTKNFNAPFLFVFPAGFIWGSAPVAESVSRRMRFFKVDTESGAIY